MQEDNILRGPQITEAEQEDDEMAIHCPYGERLETPFQLNHRGGIVSMKNHVKLLFPAVIKMYGSHYYKNDYHQIF